MLARLQRFMIGQLVWQKSSLIGQELLQPLPIIDHCRWLHVSCRNDGKKYTKYYYTPKNSFKKEEIHRVSRIKSLLPQEKIQSKPPVPAELSPEQASNLRDLEHAMASCKPTRLFAIVHLNGKQYKVTTGDLLHITGGTGIAQPGDELILQKTLLIGCGQFSVIGRPLVSADLAIVRATVVERTLEAPKICFDFRKRQNYRSMNIHQSRATVLRITDIQLNKQQLMQQL